MTRHLTDEERERILSAASEKMPDAQLDRWYMSEKNRRTRKRLEQRNRDSWDNPIYEADLFG